MRTYTNKHFNIIWMMQQISQDTH